jgi:Protein of unknown function (DUF3667)
MDICQNCGAEVSTKYCPDCGQERITKRLEVKSILHEVTHGFFHWENSILRTFKLLATQPGKFVSSYIKGKRKSFVKPFSYFLSLQTIFVVIFHLMSEKYFAYLNITVTSAAKAEKIAELQHLIRNNVNYFNFFLPLIFAFFFKLFLKKKTDVNYAESLVFSFYVFGTLLVISALFMLISFIDMRLYNVRFLFSYVYLVYAVLQYSGFSRLKGILTGTAIIILSYFVFMVLVVGFTFWYVFYFIK